MSLRAWRIAASAAASARDHYILTITLTGLASDSRAGGGSGRRSPRPSASVVAMAAGAWLGAWLVIHHGLGIPLLVAAVTAGVLAVVASGRE